MSERYFAGTRSLIAARSSSTITYTETVGSPARFDPDYVSGAIAMGQSSGANNLGLYVQMPICGPRTIIADTRLCASYRIYYASISGASGLRVVSFITNTGISKFRVATTGTSGQCVFEYWNGSTAVNLGNFSFPTSGTSQIVLDVLPLASGGFARLYINGTLVVGATSMPGLISDGIDRVRLHPWNGQAHWISEAALADFDLRPYRFGSDALNANGTYNDGTGNSSDTGDASFATFKGLPVVGDRFTGTAPARSLIGTEVIESVMLSMAARAVSPVGNAAALLVSGSAEPEQAFNPALTPGFELRQAYWDVDPNTGLPWTAGGYNAAQKGARALA
jgi:hypothetical protein